MEFFVCFDEFYKMAKKHDGVKKIVVHFFLKSVILDGGTLISPPNRKNIYEIVLYWKRHKNKTHFMVFQNFQILKFEMADFDLAAKSKKIFV